MRLKIEKEELLKALKIAKTVISKNAANPILQTVLLETVENGLRITCTDTANTIVYTCLANIELAGTACVSMTKLYNIVEKLDSVLNIECLDDLLVVKRNKTVFDLMTFNSDDFPKTPIPVRDNYYLISEGCLSNALSKISYIPQESTHNIISGVNFLFANGKLELCATDGNRLGIINLAYNGDNVETSFVLSAKVLEVVKNAQSDIKISMFRNNVIIEGANFVYQVRVFEGVYPKYQQLIPKEFSKTVYIDKNCLIKSLEKIAIMADERTNIVKVTFTNSEAKLESSTYNNKAKDVIEVKSEGIEKSFEIGFNYKYLLDCLKVSEVEEICLEMSSEVSACLITTDFTSLIMPIKISH